MFTKTINLLEDLQNRASNGHGCILVLQGESGVGKSYAVKAFLRRHHSPGNFLLLSAKGRPQVPNPLYPIYEALAEHLRVSRWKPSALRNLFKEYIVMLPRMASLIRPLLQDDAYLRGIEATIKSHLFEVSPYPHCLDFIKRLAEERSLVFWIDDVQWADLETLGFISYLRDHIAEERILLVLCLNRRRKGVLDRERLNETLEYLTYGESDGNVLFYECRPCAADEIMELMESILGGQVIAGDKLLDSLFDKSRGVPYVLKTFLEVLRSNGKISSEGSLYRFDDSIEDLSLPDSLGAAIEERLRGVYRAMPQARSVMELAAVIGDRFEDTTIDSILDLCTTYQLLIDVEDNYFLVRSLFSQGIWEFDHVTVRDFIYDVLGERAAHLHRRIAQHLQTTGSEDFSRIAYHYQHAGDSEFGITYTIRQAEKWLSQGFFAQARDALESLWKMPQFFLHPDYRTREASLIYMRALAYFNVSDYETCLQIIDLLRDDKLNAVEDPHAILLKAKCLNKQHTEKSFHEALQLLQTLMDRPEICSEHILLGRIKAEAVVSLAHLNRFADAHALFSQAEHLLNPYEAPIERAQLMRRSCLFYEPELAERVLLQAAEIFERHHVDHEVVESLNNLATVYLNRDDLRNATIVLTRAIKKSAHIGNFGMDYLLNNMSLVRLLEGEEEQALIGLREALGFAKRQVCRIIILNNQAAALLTMGEITAAEELLSRLLPDAEIVREDVYLVAIRFNLAFAYAKSARPSKALDELVRCRTERVRALGSYYERQRSRLLWAALRQLGALRDSAAEPTNLFGMLMPHVIDMQFWGD